MCITYYHMYNTSIFMLSCSHVLISYFLSVCHVPICFFRCICVSYFHVRVHAYNSTQKSEQKGECRKRGKKRKKEKKITSSSRSSPPNRTISSEFFVYKNFSCQKTGNLTKHTNKTIDFQQAFVRNKYLPKIISARISSINF